MKNGKDTSKNNTTTFKAKVSNINNNTKNKSRVPSSKDLNILISETSTSNKTKGSFIGKNVTLLKKEVIQEQATNNSNSNRNADKSNQLNNNNNIKTVNTQTHNKNIKSLNATKVNSFLEAKNSALKEAKSNAKDNNQDKDTKKDEKNKAQIINVKNKFRENKARSQNKQYGTVRKEIDDSNIRRNNNEILKELTPTKKVSFIGGNQQTNRRSNYDRSSFLEQNTSLYSESLFSKNSSILKTDNNDINNIYFSNFSKDFENIIKNFKDLTNNFLAYDISNNNPLQTVRENSNIISQIEVLNLNANMLNLQCNKLNKTSIMNDSIYRKSMIVNNLDKKTDLSFEYNNNNLFKRESLSNNNLTTIKPFSPINELTLSTNEINKEFFDSELKAEEEFIKNSSANRVNTYKQMFKSIKNNLKEFIDIFKATLIIMNNKDQNGNNVNNQYNVNFNFNLTEIKYLNNEKVKVKNNNSITSDENLQLNALAKNRSCYQTTDLNIRRDIEFSSEKNSKTNFNIINSRTSPDNNRICSQNYNIVTSNSFHINPVTNNLNIVPQYQLFKDNDSEFTAKLEISNSLLTQVKENDVNLEKPLNSNLELDDKHRSKISKTSDTTGINVAKHSSFDSNVVNKIKTIKPKNNTVQDSYLATDNSIILTENSRKNTLLQEINQNIANSKFKVNESEQNKEITNKLNKPNTKIQTKQQIKINSQFVSSEELTNTDEEEESDDDDDEEEESEGEETEELIVKDNLRFKKHNTATKIKLSRLVDEVYEEINEGEDIYPANDLTDIVSWDDDLPDTHENIPEVCLPRLKTRKVFPTKKSVLMKKEASKRFKAIQNSKKKFYTAKDSDKIKKNFSIASNKDKEKLKTNEKKKRTIYLEKIHDKEKGLILAQYELNDPNLKNNNNLISPKNSMSINKTKKTSTLSSTMLNKILCPDSKIVNDDDIES